MKRYQELEEITFFSEQEWDSLGWKNGWQVQRVAAKHGWMERPSWSLERTLGLVKKPLSTWLQGVSDLSGFCIFSSVIFCYSQNKAKKIAPAFLGARVILACRDMDRANKAAEDVRKRSGNENVIVRKLDLASLQSVRQLASDVLASEERLDVLINNAGRCVSDIWWCEALRQTSEAALQKTLLGRVKHSYILTRRYYELSEVEDWRWVWNAVWCEPPGPLPVNKLSAGSPEEVGPEPRRHRLQHGSSTRCSFLTFFQCNSILKCVLLIRWNSIFATKDDSLGRQVKFISTTSIWSKITIPRKAIVRVNLLTSSFHGSWPRGCKVLKPATSHKKQYPVCKQL